ncbi:MAG: DsbA family protein [Fimbriimonadaceae bacterium]
MITIDVAHDFICPWCWIGWKQGLQLEEEFGIQLNWIGYELFPPEMPWPEPGPPLPDPPANRPKTPSRLELAYAAQGMEKPTVQRPRHMRIHNALQAVEHAKRHGDHRGLVNALYPAYWEDGQAIGELEVLERLAAPYVENIQDMLAKVEARTYNDEIIPYDEEAYARGVYNVPTFFIDGERYSEQPYMTIAKAMREFLK